MALLRDGASKNTACSYCGTPGAADIEVLLNAIANAIAADYTDPANELPYESAEGGYQGKLENGKDIVDNHLTHWTDNEQLAQDASDAFQYDEWCRRDYFAPDRFRSLSYGWRFFAEQTKHRTRYLFLQELGSEDDFPSDPNEIPPGRMLEELGELFLHHDMFATLPEGSELTRARVVNLDEYPASAAEMGTPPIPACTLPNRMSPAGIPMFYGAFDEDTAVIETYQRGRRTKKKLALATFRCRRDLLLLDLTALPDIPSSFDDENRDLQKAILFLRTLEREFTQPIDRQNRSHVDYVPTQVVTEFVRHRLRHGNDAIDGIKYRSSRDRRRIAVVIFADPDQCVPRTGLGHLLSKPMLEYTSVRYASPSDFRRLWRKPSRRAI